MELDCELWVGDAAWIATMRVRKQKTDRQDAELLLKLMIEDRFPRVWISSLEDRDLQQLLWHRYRTVQMRTRILNQLQSIAMNEGIQRRAGLRSVQGRKRLEQIPLGPWGARRRNDLLTLLDQMNERVNEFTAAVQQEAEKRPEARLNTQLSTSRLAVVPGYSHYNLITSPEVPHIIGKYLADPLTNPTLGAAAASQVAPVPDKKQ